MADEKDIAKYQEAIARAWERLGYPKDLAKIRVEIGDTEESEDLELLAQRIRNDYIILEKNKCAQAYKLLGDIRMKQGHTAKAFEFYIQAADYAKHSYVKKELARIILQDLSKGSTKAVVYARRADGMEFMNHWLDKYGSIEDIQRLVNAII
jgi:lipopolysaccharide cholinephosphotransferase